MKTGDGWLAVWPVAAFFLGGLATQLTSWVNHRRQRAEQAEQTVADERKRREEFELAHLVEFNRLLRELHKVVRDLEAAKLQGASQEELAPFGAAMRSAQQDARGQVGFILSTTVRHCAEDALDYLGVAFKELEAERTPLIRRPIHSSVEKAYRSLSARVRELYEDRELLP
ncbi:hypothetical protein ACWGLG_16350 [Streptomyces antimycoticus]